MAARKAEILATADPALAAEWHPTKNGDLTPDLVRPSSPERRWWQCAKNPVHVWDAPVRYRYSSKAACPACNNRLIIPGDNDLATLSPDLAAEWHPTKNGELTPQMVSATFNKPVWWQCGVGDGHEWTSSVWDRQRGKGCPICKGKKLLVGFNDLATVSPEIAAQWHPTKNGSLRPTDVLRSVATEVWWQCPKNDEHAWKTSCNNRAKGSGCPYCSGYLTNPGETDLLTRFPSIASEWHPTKNGDLSPSSISPGSKTKVWWQCPRNEMHVWNADVSSRTHGGAGCLYCSGKKVLAGDNDLASRYPDVAAQWHPTRNGTLTPDQVTCGSGRKVWWKCTDYSDHEWCAVIGQRTPGGKCPICSGRKLLKGFNDLASKNPELASEWHPTKNGDNSPEMVMERSGKKAWWLCGVCAYEWTATPNKRTHGRGCPACAKFGFKPERPGWLYLIRHPEMGLLQIGISNNPEVRLAQHAVRGWVSVDLRGPMAGTVTRSYELGILAALSVRGVRLGAEAGIEKFDGYSEAWRASEFTTWSIKKLIGIMHDYEESDVA